MDDQVPPSSLSESLDLSQSLLTFVVVTYNSAQVVGACLDALRRVAPGVPVIVVDNASDDQTCAIAGRVGYCEVVPLSRNIGFGGAANEGVKRARSKLVTVMNPDVFLEALDRDELRGVVDAEPVKFGLAVPLLSETRRRLPPRHHIYAQRPWILDGLLHAWAPLLPSWKPKYADLSGARPEGWVSGAMVTFSVSEYIVLGGYSEDFFLYWEDRDLSERYLARGYPVRRLKGVRAAHLGGASSSSATPDPRPQAWDLLGYLEYVHKHLGARASRWAIRIIKASLRAQGCLAILSPSVARHAKVQRKAQQLALRNQAFLSAAKSQDGTPAHCWPRSRAALTSRDV